MTTTLAYSLTNAAEASGLSRSTLHRAIKAGTLRAQTTELDAETGRPKRGARIVIQADALKAYLDALPEA